MIFTSLVQVNPPNFFIYFHASFCCCLFSMRNLAHFVIFILVCNVVWAISRCISLFAFLSCLPRLRTFFLSHTTISIIASWDSSVHSSPLGTECSARFPLCPEMNFVCSERGDHTEVPEYQRHGSCPDSHPNPCLCLSHQLALVTKVQGQTLFI